MLLRKVVFPPFNDTGTRNYHRENLSWTLKIEKLPSSFRIIDRSYNRELSPGYHLSFTVSLTGFAYCLFDLQQKRFTGLEEVFFRKLPNYQLLSEHLKSFVSDSEVLNSGFKKVSFGIYNDTATLVPSALYDDSGKKEILQLNYPGDHFQAAGDFLQNLDVYNVFHLPEILQTTVKGIYGNAVISHFSSSLLESLFTENKNMTGLKIYLHFIRKNTYGSPLRFEIIVFSNGKLLFFNNFYFQEKEDIAYYLLFALEQLNINPGEATVTMIGNIQKSDEAVPLINNYVQEVSFGSLPGDYSFSPGFEEIPPHFYYALFCQPFFL